MPITESQANNLEQTKAELRTQKGTYREKNYKDLVKQRYNERNIRKYKSRIANAEKMLVETTDPTLHEVLMNDISRNKQYVRAWQKRQRDLLAKNTYLKREYRRESPSKMAQDLGVHFELKDKDTVSIKVEGVNEEVEITYSKMLLNQITNKKLKEATEIEKQLTRDIKSITENADGYNVG